MLKLKFFFDMYDNKKSSSLILSYRISKKCHQLIIKWIILDNFKFTLELFHNMNLSTMLLARQVMI